MAMIDFAIRDRLPELWRQIDNTHFSYLETDDSPEKLDQRKKLEGYILDYLCIVPHKNKFVLQETGEILSRSALSDPTFSGYRLARGWAAIARYAGNLLSQPWRKEYCSIRLYSGFYKHEVEGSGLCGAETMLSAMGYKPSTGDEISANTYSLDGPVCPDQVAAVSRDSLIAYVECQIMTQIWEEVALRGGNCSWLEILRCRETFTGNIDMAVTTLLQSQRGGKDLYCNVKFPAPNMNVSLKQNIMTPSIQSSSSNSSQINGHILETNNHNIPYSTVQPIQTNGSDMLLNDQGIHPNSVPLKNHGGPANNYTIINNHTEHHGMYCANPINPVPNPVHQMNGMHRGPFDYNQMYGCNTMGSVPLNHFPPSHGYYCNPMPGHSYVMQTPHNPYGPVRHASTLPLSNGYHCPTIPQPAYCPNVPTGQLIELETPNYTNNNRIMPSHNCCSNLQMSSPKHYHSNDRMKCDNISNSRDHHLKNYNDVDISKNSINYHNKKLNDVDCEIHDNIRRNSAPRSSLSNSSDHFQTLPRSDTQPSLSKAREDGMGTFESWDYVFRNLESQGYSKDLGDRGNVLSPPLERDSKTLGRTGVRDAKKYQQTTMDLEDALRAISLEKSSDEEVFRTAKINETLQKIKLENDAKAAKAHSKKNTLSDERDKRKPNTYENPSVSPITDLKVSDKTRLISKEDCKDKKEMDKEVYVNGHVKMNDSRKSKKSIVKCLSSEVDKNLKKKPDHAVVSSNQKKTTNPQNNTTNHSNHSYQPHRSTDTVDQGLKTRLVVSLHDNGHTPDENKTSVENAKNPRKIPEGKWECATCTYLNTGGKNACEICGKSRQIGVEALPLTSGGKECPACTLVNQRQAVVCAVCDTSLKHSPTYI